MRASGREESHQVAVSAHDVFDDLELARRIDVGQVTDLDTHLGIDFTDRVQGCLKAAIGLCGLGSQALGSGEVKVHIENTGLRHLGKDLGLNSNLDCAVKWQQLLTEEPAFELEAIHRKRVVSGC